MRLHFTYLFSTFPQQPKKKKFLAFADFENKKEKLKMKMMMIIKMMMMMMV
jgi:hypothetical protein